MHDRLQAEIRPGEMRWRLPRRDLRGLRRIAWFGLPVAAGLFVFAGFWAFPHIGELREGVAEPGWGLLFDGLFLLPALFMVVVGLRILLTVLTVAGNRTWSEVRLKDGDLWAREHFGGWNPKRSVSVERAESLLLSSDPDVIKPGWTDRRGGRPVRDLPVPREETFTLQLRTGGTPFTVAAMYPEGLLFELGNQLVSKSPGLRRVDLPDNTPKPAEAGAGTESLENPPPELPADTRIVRFPSPEGLELRVPARGLWKGSHGLFGFAIFWCLGSGVCRVERRSFFGRKTLEFRSGELKRIHRAPTGTSINHVPVYGVYLTPLQGKAVYILPMLGAEEQEWVAAELRRELGVSA